MIFYLHIPKTGGQSLATCLASAFPIGKADIISSDLVYPAGVEELLRMAKDKELIERHVTGPVLKDSFDIDVLTTIREPIAQIASNYLHIRREPRNWLHRPATLLSPKDFFEKFGDLLENHQSRYLIGAFFALAIHPDRLRYWASLIFDALDRIRWIVPTESIDDFIPLWSIETARPVPCAHAYVNVAQKDAGYEELLAIVRNYPRLYSLDLLLWQTAQERFANYKEGVLRTAVPWTEPNNTSRAYWNNGSGIWLLNGWHPPQVGTPVGTAWWAGPERYSEIVYQCQSTDRYLQFSVVVMCGVYPNRIYAVSHDKRTTLNMRLLSQSNDRWNYWIDLNGMPLKGRFYLWVPDVFAPIMFAQDSTDVERKSFATCDWSFAKELPCEARPGSDPREIPMRPCGI